MTIDEAALGVFASAFRGQLIRPGDASYDEARSVWNGMIDRRPALIARCADAADVAGAVRFARDHDVVASVRGGGHSAAGKAVCDAGIVIDLSTMRGVQVDPDAETARAEGGARWGDYDQATQSFGLASPGGVVSTTGIAGLTLGGGFGWLTRRFGLACDNLRSVDLVLADGELVTASEDENTDLFWGVRGGGGNFGIATSFEYRVHPVGPLILGALLAWPLERGPEILRVYREFVADLPEELGIEAMFVTAPPLPFIPEDMHFKPAIATGMCWSGPVDDGRKVMAPLLDLDPPGQMVEAMPYTVMQSLQDGLAPPGRRSYWKAGYLKGLGDDIIESVVAHAANVPSPFSLAEIVRWGGATARVGKDETAFGNREAPFLFNAVSMWEGAEGDDANVAWARDFYTAVGSELTEGVYVNFLSDEGDARVREAYGPEKYARLASLKAKYDPDNFFRSNQNIDPGG